VNSFGFGGTNAHAIIESWEPDGSDNFKGESLQLGSNKISTCPRGPITLSANSERSLLSATTNLADLLRSHDDSILGNLLWTLQTRQANFQYKASFAGSSREDLLGKLDAAVKKARSDPQYSLTTSAIQVTEIFPPRILGIFTGQGAQWPSMGAGLYEESALFRESIQELEESLKTLPDAPSWSLAEELKASAESSRVHEAAISQPLCTAIQIALVDLLRASGISFSAVLGHSSGEIGAAYASGYLKACDAIRIAHYRGLYAIRAGAPSGLPGKMMAVGMGFEEAGMFCRRDQFLGRIKVAASNARSSVTLSGDGDAIDEAKSLLDGEGVFARVLKVDTAYHSHHMEPCAGPYLESLRRCDIHIQSGADACKWYSSVYGPNGRSVDDTEALGGTYWVENMVKPVLFSEAIDRAITEEHCHDMVLEIGPHPALKGPATESLKTLTGIDMPYTGVLKRGENDMCSFSAALGFVWAHFQSPLPVVHFDGFRRACLGEYSGKAGIMTDPSGKNRDGPGNFEAVKIRCTSFSESRWSMETTTKYDGGTS
jgi:hybrid polyketide synthase/nonribosomal peptide synthetase ACE1